MRNRKDGIARYVGRQPHIQDWIFQCKEAYSGPEGAARDYQPTIDRARSHAEVAERRIAKLREKKDEIHREMLRAQAAARIANEEADALRDRITGLEQSARDLRRELTNARHGRKAADDLIEALERDLAAARRTFAVRARDWFRSTLRIAEEA